MTPAEIAKAADDLGLAMIAITDHNRIGNVEAALEAAGELSVLVLPGVELSTIQGHLLAYFPSLDSLKRFYYSLEFDADYNACRQSIPQCCDAAAANHGFCIGAHIDASGGFELEVQGYGDPKRAIAGHEGLVALEVASLSSQDWFSDSDESEARRTLLTLRRHALDRPDSYCWPVVVFSDAHTLTAFRSASNTGKVMRVKMETPSFDSLKTAFADPSSRLRIEEAVPERVPRFVGIRTSGGFLGEKTIRFSNNLTCIIGGRGTGKSTLLESLRVAAGYRSDSKLVDSEVWPDLIELLYEDETGAQHVLTRRKLSGQLDPTGGSAQTRLEIPLESYGQGETASRIQNCQEDPGILLSFLDPFTGVENLNREDDRLREELTKNEADLKDVELRVSRLPQVVAKLNDLQAKMDSLKRQDIGELVRLEEELSGGRTFREQVISRLNDLFATIEKSLGNREPIDILMALEPGEDSLGAEHLASIKAIIEEVGQHLDAAKADWTNAAGDHITALRAIIATWKGTETELESRIEDRRKALIAQGIQPDLKSIRKITDDHAETRAQLEELRAVAKQQKELELRRMTLVKDRRRTRSRISSTRSAWARQVTGLMKGTLRDYVISIKFQEGALSPECVRFLTEAMQWRTVNFRKAQALTRHFSPFDLIDVGRRADVDRLLQVTYEDGSIVLDQPEASRLVACLADKQHRRALEAMSFEDLPRIQVTKWTHSENGDRNAVTRGFERLSLGQQQAVLLAVLMLSESGSPLIVDQPEDNLDNEFIYRTIVGNLKRTKERRQVIIVTHNANIAVLGDSELILPLKATSERAEVQGAGSIDSRKTRDAACEILEGSAEAFKRRARIYGFE